MTEQQNTGNVTARFNIQKRPFTIEDCVGCIVLVKGGTVDSIDGDITQELAGRIAEYVGKIHGFYYEDAIDLNPGDDVRVSFSLRDVKRNEVMFPRTPFLDAYGHWTGGYFYDGSKGEIQVLAD